LNEKSIESGAKISHFFGEKKTMVFQVAIYVSSGNLINTDFVPRNSKPTIDIGLGAKCFEILTQKILQGC